MFLLWPRVPFTLALFALLLTWSCTSDDAPLLTPSAWPSQSGAVAESASPSNRSSVGGEATATPPIPGSSPVAPVTLTQIGHTDLGGQGFAANVRTLGSFAYVGSWGAGRCPGSGVRVVDLSNPAAPVVAATAAQIPGTSAEDIVPLHVTTPMFTGDLLVVGIQRCSNSSAAPGGLALVDITDPRNPRDLGFFDSGRPARGVHELDVTVQNGRVLALLAVPYSSAANDGDLRIVDITDPNRPKQLAAWGPALAGLPTEGIGCNRSVNAHSVKSAPDGMRAFVSFWDAGLIILDISDPAAPRYLGRAFAPQSEGAVHSVDLTAEGFAVVAEEDDVFRSPRRLTLRVEGSGEALDVTGCQAVGGTDIDEVGVLNGPLVDGGMLCRGAPSTSAGAILLADSGGCSVESKARVAAAAKASALVLALGQEPVALELSGEIGLPVVTISTGDGERVRSVANGMVTLPTSRPWGGVRIWDMRDPASPVQVGGFHTDGATRFPSSGPGSYAVHNPLRAGRYVLLAWYADGVRVVDFSDPAHPVEVASFVPPPAADPQRTFATAPYVWGVAVSGNLVLVSDINGGLYVLRATGLSTSTGP